jgi:predicted CXXCH cytochrome family protein
MKRTGAVALFVVGLAAGFVVSGARAQIVGTAHNLSASSPATIRAQNEGEICVFCHVPHNAATSGPLWNRRAPTLNYTLYGSSTTVATIGQPTGASLLCLSCHDGTIALGDVLSRGTPITMAGGVTTMPVGPGLLGKDISGEHPVSFVYDNTLVAARGALVAPASLTGAVRLDKLGRMQCTACHDPHENPYGKFLVASNRASALCTTCHQVAGWSGSSHQVSAAIWNGSGTNPWSRTSWTTVADNACESCHRPHSAGGKQRLLNAAAEEENCYSCHNGNVAPKSVQAEFAKISRHPVEATTGTHDPMEPAVVTSRHVECADCHNAHAAVAGAGTPSGPLTAVRGVSLTTGVEVAPATFEYQICLRCHGDSPGKPASAIARLIVQNNARLEFDPVNPSYHPVAGARNNPDVPSLLWPLNSASTVLCSDCHGDDDGPRGGGGGPNGPHGSIYRPLLARAYLTADYTPEGPAAYDLCYQCHDRANILADKSFKHARHLTVVQAPCSACHDAHGISLTQGNATNNKALINFDLGIVGKNTGGQLLYQSTGTFHGQCYLSCHGIEHNPPVTLQGSY